MTHQETIRAELRAYLDQEQLPYTEDALTGFLSVQTSLGLIDEDVSALPDDLTVHGTLSLSGLTITELPRRLKIHGNMELEEVKIPELPDDMQVTGTIEILYGAIMQLPERFTTLKGLCLYGHPISVLPSGMHIQGNINLGLTQITRFPKDMRIDGAISPPPGLLDLHAFMQTQSDGVVLTYPSSAHGQIALRSQLLPFPDVWTMIRSLGTEWSIQIHADGTGGYRAESRIIKG